MSFYWAVLYVATPTSDHFCGKWGQFWSEQIGRQNASSIDGNAAVFSGGDVVVLHGKCARTEGWYSLVLGACCCACVFWWKVIFFQAHKLLTEMCENSGTAFQ